MTQENPYLKENPYLEVGEIPKTENLLQKAIRISTKPFGMTLIPSSMEEVKDIPRIALNFASKEKIPLTETQAPGAFLAEKIGGITNLGTEPKTDYGRNAEKAIEIAPFIGGGISAAKGIKKFLSSGDLPQKIQQVKGSIYDLVKKTPEEVKGKVGTLFNEFRREFGARLSTMRWNLNNSHFAEALQSTADELGTARIAGTDGQKIASLAEQFRNGGFQNYNPTEVQALTGKLLGNMDSLSQAKFYRNFMNVLERQDPAFAQLKRDYAPVFDIAKNSKRLKSSAIRDVASDKIGPESLADVAESEQMLYPQGGGPVEKASAKGEELRTLTSKLDKIFKRQETAKKVGKYTAGGVATLLGLGGLKKYFSK